MARRVLKMLEVRRHCEQEENYTREHDGDTVTVELFDAFRKELGM